MKNKTIHTVIILGILSLVTILTVQLLWMKKTIRIQETNIAIQSKADSLNLKEFTQQVEVSLKKVLKQINLNTNVNYEVYGAVKELKTDLAKLREELPKTYAQRDDVRDDFKEIKQMLTDIYQELRKKADK